MRQGLIALVLLPTVPRLRLPDGTFAQFALACGCKMPAVRSSYCPQRPLAHLLTVRWRLTRQVVGRLATDLATTRALAQRPPTQMAPACGASEHAINRAKMMDFIDHLRSWLWGHKPLVNQSTVCDQQPDGNQDGNQELLPLASHAAIPMRLFGIGRGAKSPVFE